MILENSRVLVLGGMGFIGSHLVSRLASVGAKVTVVDAARPPSPDGLCGNVTYHRLLLPDSRLRELVAGSPFDVVFHLAGTASVPASVEDPMADLRSNAEVTIDLLEGMRLASSGSRLVYTSSAAVYGEPRSLPIMEDHSPAPMSPYGVSKLAAERYVTLYARLHGLHTSVVRPFSVFGPGLRRQVVFDLISRLWKNRDELVVWGTAEAMRDFIFVDDVVTAMLCVATRGEMRGEAYNVASGRGVTIRELVDTIVACMQLKPRIRYSGAAHPGNPQSWVADISRTRSLGFAPSTSLEEGIARVAAWYLQNPEIL